MAKKTKDLEPTTSNEKVKAKKETSASKKATAKKVTVKKTATAKRASSKTSSSSEKKNAAKTTTAKKSSLINKKLETTSTSKKNTSKKATIKKTSTAKKPAASKKTTTSRRKKAVADFKSEYYDLPYMYNKTVVKVLAQTPKMLFIYWEISVDDRKRLQKSFGENFFNSTRPVLIVYNDTLHYSFEVDINDFANSWYIQINDANCDYHVELGRRPIDNQPNSSNTSLDLSSQPAYIPYYIYLTSSNEMTVPNNKILFDPNLEVIKFRNVKTGQTFEKDINQFTFITNFGIFNVQDLYKVLYPNENFEFENVFIGNPSSGLTSSGMFSSQFK